IVDVVRDFQLRLEKIGHIETQDHGKKLHFKLDGFDNKKYTVYADRFRIAQVISNLIENSLNFIITKAGLISISLEKRIENKDDTTTKIVLVQIKDNGQGIDPKVIPNL